MWTFAYLFPISSHADYSKGCQKDVRANALETYIQYIHLCIHTVSATGHLSYILHARRFLPAFMLYILTLNSVSQSCICSSCWSSPAKRAPQNLDWVAVAPHTQELAIGPSKDCTCGTWLNKRCGFCACQFLPWYLLTFLLQMAAGWSKLGMKIKP